MAINVDAHAHPVPGAWIVTTASMDDNRNVNCTIGLTATYKFASFHAMVRLEYVSATGHLLGMSQQWQADCGPAPLFGAAHGSGNFTETAPAGTTEIRVVQIAQYSLNFNNLLGPIEWVIQQISNSDSSGQFNVPDDPGTPDDTDVDPPDWNSVTALKGLVEVTSSNAH